MVLVLSASQLNAMQVTERVTSIFSLFGILFILSTFSLARGFDKPINRLIFFASWSNLGMNIATLIAEDGPNAGQNSSLCQFQAFAIQMFLGVDVFWALCMSVNVYLALFRGWTAQRMRAQEWKYFAACYGASFIPALIYVFVKTESQGRVYGPALLWCWITPKWAYLRLVTLYAIVWLAIFFAFCIYCLAFMKVWRNRHELTGLFNPFNENPFEAMVTTSVDIVRTDVEDLPAEVKSSPAQNDWDTESPPAMTKVQTHDGPTSVDPYTVDVEVGHNEESNGRQMSLPEVLNVRQLTRHHALSVENSDAWLYARVAFLFFCALLISWVPSSINRLYSIIRPNDLNFGLNYTETLVLPLQGFFNACVYIITSQSAVRGLFKSFFGRLNANKRRLSSNTKSNRNDTLISMDKGEEMYYRRKTMNSTVPATGMTKAGVGESKMDRFARTRSQQRSRPRLESDTSSLTSLTPAHTQPTFYR